MPALVTTAAPLRTAQQARPVTSRRAPAALAVRCQQHGTPSAPAHLSRRALVALPAVLGVALNLSSSAPPASAAAPVDWDAVKADVIAVMADPKSPGGIGERGPTLVRLAWHASGTYDRMSKTGGSNGGTIRFKEELSHGANAGLATATSWLEPVHAKHPDVSFADLVTYAGCVAVEAMGGPHVTFRSGRLDAVDPSTVTPDGRLPAADKGSPARTAAGLRETFGRMGFGDQEIVALSGAHALGRCHVESSGYVGPWQGTPTIFSNIYFKLLAKQEKNGDYWTPDGRFKQPQFKDPSGTLMMLPSDLVLVQDDAFRKHVDAYAKDKALFYADFAAAFQKLEELGTKGLTLVA